MAARISKSLAASLSEKRGAPVSGSNKFNAKRTAVGNLMFASKAEAARYCYLRILQDRGEIKGLELQPRFRLMVYGNKICDYIADFKYINPDGSVIIEDVKGVITPAFSIKRKLMRACLGVEISIVR